MGFEDKKTQLNEVLGMGKDSSPKKAKKPAAKATPRLGVKSTADNFLKRKQKFFGDLELPNKVKMKFQSAGTHEEKLAILDQHGF